MNPLRLTALAAVSLLSLSVGAQADDFYTPARPLNTAYGSPSVFKNWTGVYFGGVAGGAFADKDKVSLCDGRDANNCVRGSFDGRATGSATFGGTLGFNYQAGSFVLGAEGDYSYLNLSTRNRLNTEADDKNAVGNPYTTAGTGSARSTVNSLGTVRARLGYLVNPAFMIYGSGGLAFGDTSQNAVYSIPTGVPSEPSFSWNNKKSEFKTGFAAGGGIEYAFNQNWSVKTEAYYINLGGRDQLLTNDRTTLSFKVKGHESDFIVGRVGLNYKF